MAPQKLRGASGLGPPGTVTSRGRLSRVIFGHACRWSVPAKQAKNSDNNMMWKTNVSSDLG